MPPRSELPGTLAREKFIKALIRLGFEIRRPGGKGGHIKAIWPSSQKAVSIPERLDRDVIYYLLKQIMDCSGISWDQVKREL